MQAILHPRLCLVKDLSGVYMPLWCDAVVTMEILIFFLKFSEDNAVTHINNLSPWQAKLYSGRPEHIYMLVCLLVSCKHIFFSNKSS